MSFPSLAIIGTAGRKEDQDRLTHAHYTRMVQATTTLMSHFKIDPQTVRVVSGGAAWADHIAVTLALMGGVRPENLTLYLPTPITEQGYTGDTSISERSAGTANFYHRLFSDKTGYDSIAEILEVARLGATLIPGNGSFHARNTDVAKFVSPDGALLAFTFGEPYAEQVPWTIKQFTSEALARDAGLKDGGTADTFNKSRCTKFHALIGEMPADELVEF